MYNFCRVRRFGVFPLVAFMCLLAYAPRTRAQKGVPCCTITKIDARSGVVTAVVKQSGEPFEFRVTDANLLKSLKIGQGVYANFATHQVSVNGKTPCCDIISLAPATGATSLPAAPPAGNVAGQVNPASPCCGITAINTQTGIVTAKENATGRIFTFKVTDASLLKSLQLGQGVYANFATRQVSLDGKTACCTIVSVSLFPGVTPQSGPAPSPAPSPSGSSGSRPKDSSKSNKVQTQDKNTKDLGTSNTEIKANEATTGQAIRRATAGNPPQTRPVPTLPVFSREPSQIRTLAQGKGWSLQTVSGTVGGRLVKDEALYHIVGKEGISESPIPAQIKNELLRDAANSRGNDTVYIVHKNSAETVAALLAQRSSGSTPPPSNSVTQTGSSDNGCNDMFGWGNHVNRTASISFNIPGDLAMLDLNDVGKKYVNVSGSLQIKAPANGHLTGELGLSVLDSFCQPIGFKFRFFHVTGDMEVSPSLDLDAEVGMAYQFKWRPQETQIKLGEYGFAIGPIPVVIGFDAFLEGRLDIKVPNLAHVKYSAHGNGHAGLDAQCDMNGCSATPSGSFTWSDAGNVTLLAQGVRVIVKPGVLAAVEAYLYNPVVVNSHVGVEPYVKGDFWAYSGSCTGQGGVPRDNATAKALTADLDGGFDVLAGIDASGEFPNGFLSPLLNQEFTVYNWEKHLLFRDLIGSTALTPAVKTDPPAYATYPETVQVGMRSCYPYTKDKDGNPLTITYRAEWGDGTPASSVQAQSPADASAAHSWAAPGQYTATFRPERDSHGREFPMQATQVAMEVKAGLPPPVRRLRNGNTPGVPSTPVPNPVSQSLESIGATLAAPTNKAGVITVQSTPVPNLISQHEQNLDANPDHLPDLVPSFGPDPNYGVACYYDPRTESCQQACPPFTARTPLGVKNLTQYAVTGPILVTLQDMAGNTVRTWTVNGLPGYGEALPGNFSYQAPSPCPAPGTTVSAFGTPAPNYTLLVAPPSGVTELQTNNNSAQIYIRPDATIAP